MSRYAFLVLPSVNRVHCGASAALVRAELEVFDRPVLSRATARLGRGST